MDVISGRAQAFFLPASSSPTPPRKLSAPVSPYQSTAACSPHTYTYGRGSLLPMPPNYNEGSCWTLASLRILSPGPPESRPRTIRVEVTKISLRMDGRWAEEKPYVLDKTWDEWLEVREKIIQRYPETEALLPKLSKTHGFLESIFTNSKRSNSAQNLNMKELNNFLSCLVGKTSKKVINSSLVQNFFQTEEMRVGTYQVQYTTDDLPTTCREPLTAQAPMSSHDDTNGPACISSHLKSFRFPERKLDQSPPSQLKPKNSQPNLSARPWVVGPEGENVVFNEKLSSYHRSRPAPDPMAVIIERPLPPDFSSSRDNAHLPRPSTMSRALGNQTARLTNKSRHPIRPTTGVIRAPSVAPPKRPNTSDSRSLHDPMMKPALSSAAKFNHSPPPAPPTRRPSENFAGLTRQAEGVKPTRPRLREFKSMQDIRTTAGTAKFNGHSGRNGIVDPPRNNSVPAVGENPQLGYRVRSPTTSRRKHRRTPSDSSSSFGSSQLSPISSVMSSPTVAPSNSTTAMSKSVSNHGNPYKLAPRRSIDSLGPNFIGCDGSNSLKLIHDPETRRTFAHHTVPPAPFYPIPPALLNPILVSSPKANPLPPHQKRPHTSAGNASGQVSNLLTLKVVHPESKTNIILGIQRGLFSLQQIKTKIQNKMKMADDVELPENWKIRLVMIDQEEFLRRGEIEAGKDVVDVDDDGFKLLELVNGRRRDSPIKKITMRII